MTLKPSLHRLSLLPVAVLSALSYIAIARGDDAPRSMPPIKDTSNLGGFPSVARRLYKQGRFLVELSISERGKVTNVLVLKAEPRGIFDANLGSYLRSFRFDVPEDWVSSGGPALRFKLSVLYLLRPCLPHGPCEDLEPFAGDNIVTITGSPIPLPAR